MTMCDKVKKGLPIDDVLIIDSHNHLGKWGAFYVPQGGTIEQMITSMNLLGVDKICVTAMSSIGPDYIYGNDMVIEAMKKYPDRVIGYVTVNPTYPEDMKHELDRCFSNSGFKGIKMHPGCHGHAIDDKNYKPAFEEADRRGCPVLIHTWGDSDISAFEIVAAEYKNANFIMAHCGGNWSCFPHAVDVINKHDNIYGDFAVASSPEGNVEWFVEQVGSKKMLFGTDMPFYDPSPTLARVAMARISDEAKADILGLNMKSLLKL